MAKVLAILGSARKKGYTAGLLEAAVEGARAIENVETDLVRIHDYKIGPCTSCYACIRDEKHRCILDDDLGRNGEGSLWKKVLQSNGIMIADPTHWWSPSAGLHAMIERFYPFVWGGQLCGMPAASISCASNQGMAQIATREICKWFFLNKFRNIGWLPVHVVYYDEALTQAKYLGKKLAEAALVDEKEGRKAPSDEENWFEYMDKPWNAFELYIENLTRGTYKWEQSLIEYGLVYNKFKKKDAAEKMGKAREHLIKAMNAYNLMDWNTSQKELLKATSFWTHATWSEFLEDEVIGVKAPKVYRPIDKEDRKNL